MDGRWLRWGALFAALTLSAGCSDPGVSPGERQGGAEDTHEDGHPDVGDGIIPGVPDGDDDDGDDSSDDGDVFPKLPDTIGDSDQDLPDEDELPLGPGPWPLDAAKNYTAAYGLGWVESVALDDAHNLWLLDNDRIGVLRPGDSRPTWTHGVGQAAGGFGMDQRATGSTVICGGTAGRAYVGYATYDLLSPFRDSPTDPEYLKGDVDVVKLEPDGTVSLEVHLGKTTSTSGYDAIGIRNTNDWHYDEDRSVLTCVKVMKGRDRGEIYIGTNHGVTRIRGLVYNSHRHPVWNEGNTLKIGYNYAVGIAQNGDLLIGNEWKIGMMTPPEPLRLFDDHVVAPYTLNTYAQSVNSLEEMDYWRGFQQTTDGAYYLASERYGLWRMTLKGQVGEANYAKVAGLPTDNLTTLQATEDGSLFIGTESSGLWRMTKTGAFERVSSVSGARVKQLVYEPGTTPSMLLVLVDGQVHVLRGH